MESRKHRRFGVRKAALVMAAIGTILGILSLDRPRSGGENANFEWMHLPAGTTVMPEATGWTHRVVRSVPRLASGALDSLPASSKESASLFRTVILADVARDDQTYRLARVGVGNAVPFDGREVVVTVSGPAEVIGRLSALQRVVLRVAESKLARATIEARTPTFALLRTPARLVIGGTHEDVDLRYAILVDPASGRLRTFTWATPSGSPDPPVHVFELAESTFDCAFDVEVSARIGPIPVAWSFAMLAPPGGRPIVVPRDLDAQIRALIAGTGNPEELERGFVSILATGPAP